MLNKFSRITRAIAILACSFSVSAQAASLVDVYNEAVKNDQTFRQAEATFLSASQGTDIARAALLPTIGASAQLQNTYVLNQTSVRKDQPSKGNFWAQTYSLSVSQPIFNLASWINLHAAGKTVQAAQATYTAAEQDLIARTVSAYFSVLKASDQLRYTNAEKKSVLQSLRTAEQQYKVGIIAVTGVYDAQSQYDANVALSIADQNALNNSIEALRVITGKTYNSLNGLKKTIPLLPPNPTNIDTWVGKAVKQNYALKAQQLAAEASKDNISSTRSSLHLPTLSASGSIGFLHNSHTRLNPFGVKDSTGGQAAIELNLPLYQGGVSASGTTTQQARYNYMNAVAATDFQYRQTVQNARQNYLGVIAGVSQVRADKQAVLSNQKALKATESGYAVGTRTMVDVLQSLSNLAKAQKTYASDRYDYLNNIIQLKATTGTLSPADIHWLNTLLTEQRGFSNALLSGKSYNTIVNSSYNSKTSQKSHHKHAIKAHADKKHTKKQNTFSTTPLKAGQYTIQLLATNNMQNATNFIYNRLYSSRDHLHILQHKSKGKSIYRVTLKHFASRSEARKALKKLSENLQHFKPWVIEVMPQDIDVTQKMVKKNSSPAKHPQAKKAKIHRTSKSSSSKMQPLISAEKPNTTMKNTNNVQPINPQTKKTAQPATNALGWENPQPGYHYASPGAIWDNNDAQQKCADICPKNFTWDGQWRTITWGKTSVCQCKPDNKALNPKQPAISNNTMPQQNIHNAKPMDSQNMPGNNTMPQQPNTMVPQQNIKNTQPMGSQNMPGNKTMPQQPSTTAPQQNMNNTQPMGSQNMPNNNTMPQQPSTTMPSQNADVPTANQPNSNQTTGAPKNNNYQYTVPLNNQPSTGHQVNQ